MKVFFILGTGHCGSTLLDLLLNGHSEIVGVGELATIATWNKSVKQEPFWQSVCGDFCNDDLEVYRSKENIIFGRDEFMSVSNGRQIVPSEYATLHEHLYTRIAQVSGKKYVVDSSKEPNRVELLAESPHIEPIMIHLVRDARAVSWSYERKLPDHPWYAALTWFLENMKIELVRRHLKEVPYIRVQYEELVRDPKVVLTAILALADLQFEESMLDFRTHEYHGVGGNRMKTDTNSEIKEDVSWKKEMPLKSRLICTLCFGWLNWYYRTHLWTNQTPKKES